jgi:hypothetical protein
MRVGTLITCSTGLTVLLYKPKYIEDEAMVETGMHMYGHYLPVQSTIF